MIQEEKQLLLIDLCARLPYGIICRNEESNMNVFSHMLPTNILQLKILFRDYTIKPYLRPLSSITKEEDKKWQLYKNRIAESCDGLLEKRIEELYDWYNFNHFDYRGLIEKGLALEAPKDMYK